MYSEDDLIPLSALQHLLFCERQCALIHIEQIWIENLFTAEGRIMHERVDSSGKESRGKIRVEYGLSLRSLRLGLVGKADVVEFHHNAAAGNKKISTWQPFPVEHKRGKPKKDNCDKVQLCAQAQCLEEMLHLEITCGALFYGKPRRRQDVIFDDALRQETERAAEELHALFNSKITPRPVYEKKCDSCSFIDLCIPKALSGKRSASAYLENMVKNL